jgi:hypothetical protein
MPYTGGLRPVVCGALCTAVLLGLGVGEALAQSSTTIAVTARILAACTITSGSAQSSCSEQTLAQQSDVAGASARISTSGDKTVVTHSGGLPPAIETKGNQVSVSF